MGSRDLSWPRWRLPLAVLALASILGGLVVAKYLAQEERRLPSVAGPSVVPAAAAAASAHAVVVPLARGPEATTPSGAVVAHQQDSADRLEICGFGTVPLVADDPYSLGRIPWPVRRRALDELEARLLASAEPQVQAAALLLGARARGGSRPHVDRLVRLAVVSQDPLVYAIALEACKGSADGGAPNCALLSLEQWARLDPDNAQPWFELAAQAQREHDIDAELDAMRHAALARRSDAHRGLAPSLVSRALGEATPRRQRTLAVAESWSLLASWGPSHTGQAQWYCAVDAAADPGRNDICEAIAATLADRGTSLNELGIGLSIGRHLGWPASRLHALQQEYDALSEAGGAPFIGAELSCEAIDRMQDWMRQMGTVGELQLMRDVLARSGRSVKDWSGRYQRNIALAAATAQAAAVAMASDTSP